MTASQAQQTRRVGLCLNPLDVLFFRDGRPFEAASRAYGGLPLPRTFAGALRTALLQQAGFNLSCLRQDWDDRAHVPTTRVLLGDRGAPEWILDTTFRGPWLALREKKAGSESGIVPLLASPATLLWEDVKKRWRRLEPLNQRLSGWTDTDTLPLWHHQEGEPRFEGGYLRLSGMKSFLEGGTPSRETEWFRDDELFGFDVRTGIGVDADCLTAAKSQIYAARFLSLRPSVRKKDAAPEFEVLLYEEMFLPPGAPSADTDILSGPMPLGGEGKYAAVRVVRPVSWPTIGPTSGAGRSLWVLTTPGIFGRAQAGEQPSLPADRPDTIKPPAMRRAAASMHPLAVSGWDIAMNGPKPTRFAVPAGAVYYVEGDFTRPGQSLCDDQELAAEGWGFALRGVWNHD
jgi:CRISPR-associated protein Cmr3